MEKDKRFNKLTPHNKRSVRLAIRDGRLGSTDELAHMSDTDIMWQVRGRGQANGIGKKGLENIREVYSPRRRFNPSSFLRRTR